VLLGHGDALSKREFFRHVVIGDALVGRRIEVRR